MFWQYYQEDCTGYLYYGTNNWNEYDNSNGNYEDNTVTGSFTQLGWKPNLSVGRMNGKDVYGDGVLFYGASQAKIRGVNKYVGTIRVEMLRDGVEEYEMLCMLEEYKGEKAAKDTVARLSTNIVNYISLPGFSTAGWDSDMDEYDIMAAVRKDLGNEIEAAAREGKCDHRYDEGVVAKEATCLEVGTLRRTCKDCGAVTDEVIPTLHAVGDCYKVISEIEASCYSDGSKILECTICGNTRTVYETAFHENDEYLSYEYKNENVHRVYCTVCNEEIDAVGHDYFVKHTSTCTEAGDVLDYCVDCGYSVKTGEAPAKGHSLVTEKVDATCTEDGYEGTVCKNCDFAETTVIKSEGHKFEDGTCTVCGESDPDWSDTPDYIPGDVNGDGAVNAMDANIMKRILSGTVTPTDLQILSGDVNGDGELNGFDSNFLSRIVSGKN